MTLLLFVADTTAGIVADTEVADTAAGIAADTAAGIAADAAAAAGIEADTAAGIADTAPGIGAGTEGSEVPVFVSASLAWGAGSSSSPGPRGATMPLCQSLLQARSTCKNLCRFLGAYHRCRVQHHRIRPMTSKVCFVLTSFPCSRITDPGPSQCWTKQDGPEYWSLALHV